MQTYHTKEPDCEVCKMTRARCRKKSKWRVDGIAPSKYEGHTRWFHFVSESEIRNCFGAATADIRKVHPEFREASARRHVTSYQEYHFDNNVPNRSLVQKKNQHLQMEPRTPSRKRRRHREANCRKVAPHCLAGGG